AGLPPMPKGVNLQFVLGGRFAVAALLRMLPNAMQNVMLMALLFVMVRAVSRRAWIAAIGSTSVFGVLVLGDIQDSPPVAVTYAALFSGIFVATLVYFGLLAQFVAFFVTTAIGNGVLALDMSKMYAGTGVWLMLV